MCLAEVTALGTLLLWGRRESMMWTVPKAKIMSAFDWFSLGLFVLPNRFNGSLGAQRQVAETVC